jgi:predicted RNA-binding protein YlqC (UPF0109 family)
VGLAQKSILPFGRADIAGSGPWSRNNPVHPQEEVKVKELVEMIAKSLVDDPDKVQVSQLDGAQTSIIELRVAPEDVGKVIGKHGSHAQAIRVILGAAGMKLKKRFTFELIEEQ